MMRPSLSGLSCTLSGAFLLVTACGDSSRDGASGADGTGAESGSGSAEGSADASATAGTASTSATSATAGEEGEAGEAGSGGTGPRLDVGPGSGGSATAGEAGESGAGECDPGATDPMEPGDCDDRAPPDSFESSVQWTFNPPGEPDSAVIPLVGNFTDDNGDGSIDICDIPDVLLLSSSATAFQGPGHIHVLNGADGTLHFRIETVLDATITPAFADIDGDNLPEIIAAVGGGLLQPQSLIAFEHDGTVKWQSATGMDYLEALYGAVALADIDNDGDVEILFGTYVYDHNGVLLFRVPARYYATPSGLPDPAGQARGSATAAADLDGDGDQEIILGHAAYHHDGSEYYLTTVAPGYPQIANLDGDPEPEVLITNNNGIAMLEHDGTLKYQDMRPTGDPVTMGHTWDRPATVHDFDGDLISEYALSSANNYTVYEGDASIVWQAPVLDASGIAAGTAFDFLGDGFAEAMYADEKNLFIFDQNGQVYLQTPRQSATIIEYPIVADLDNDRSAEIAVVSNTNTMGGAQPTLQIVRDVQDRWIQARRIWNQHTYHVTNVEENGKIPQFEVPSWTGLNTYRTNAQIEGGIVCRPPPVG